MTQSGYHEAVLQIANATLTLIRNANIHSQPLFIANEHAGTRARHRSVVRAAQRLVGSRAGSHPSITWTASAAEATDAVRAHIAASVAAGERRPLVVSLGGDGTHQSVLRAGATHAGNDEGAGAPMFLRIPLGSGNDSADFEGLTNLFDDAQPVLAPQWIPAVRVTSRNHMWWAFNIASLGIDAFVTAMHDRWRRLLPGNTYRIIADLAVLRFEHILKLGPMKVTLDATEPMERLFSLVAVGASGYRTYGNHMHVLPGVENVCMIGSAGLREKMRLKGLFYAGAHVSEPLTQMADARRVDIDYHGRLPLQADGEAAWIEADDWPLTFEVVDHAVRVLGAARIT